MSTSPDGLIDPGSFTVSSCEIDAGSVELAALDMARVGSRVRADASDIDTRWRGLAAAYEAPEQARVHALVRPAVVTADDVDTRLTRGSRAVRQFADALRVIKPRLADLERRAHDVRSHALAVHAVGMLDGGGQGWRDDVGLVRANDGLVQEHSRLMTDLAVTVEDCECDLRRLAGGGDGALVGGAIGLSAGGFGAGSRSVPMGPATDPTDSPWLTDRRGMPLPRVILQEENPAHLELDLAGLLPVVGEPADLVNALIYAWERDWGNALISAAGVVPVVGSAGTLARIARRTNGMPGPPPRLTQEILNHIVARHWSTAGTSRRVGKFVDGLSLSTLTGMIDAALRHGRVRSNTQDRFGAIYEIDLVTTIGINGSGREISRLRVIVDGSGEIVSAFPF